MNLRFLTGLILICFMGVIPVKALEVLLGTATFYHPGIGNYTEIYLRIPAWDLQPARVAKELKLQADITLVIRRDSSIQYADRYVLNSRSIKDSNDVNFNLIDLRRVKLDPGKYTLEVLSKDLHGASTDKQKLAFTVTRKENTPYISDLQWVLEAHPSTDSNSNFRKQGLDMLPRVLEFYGDKENSLSFYTEIYNTRLTHEGQKILLRAGVVDEKSRLINDIGVAKKADAAEVLPFAASLDISKLPTGNYYLEISVTDKERNDLAVSRTFFQRLNMQYKDSVSGDIYAMNNGNSYGFNWLDTASMNYLRFSVLSITPILDQAEVPRLDAMVKNGNADYMKNFLSNFWTKKEPLNPAQAWKSYEEKVLMVESNYSTSIEHGFQTDRGRTYLKYGAPNDIIKQKEPGGYDYEIWHYYKLDELQSNIRFIFYNPTLIVNGMELLTSNARGEKNDPNWKQRIYGTYGNRGTQNLDNTGFQDHSGSQLNKSIDSFR